MRNFITLMIVAAVALSCSSKEYQDWSKPWNGEDEGFSHDMIILGEQLQDPYSVENITRALETVSPAHAGRTAVTPTDFYVRFLPKDEAQLQRLMDLGLELVDHPLDYRIVREGDWYHDPSLPERSITWQYAVVPVDFSFPNDVRYERLDDCYLPEHDPQTRSDGIDWDEVEREAYRLTGNADMLPETRGEVSLVTIPQGRIAIIDRELGDEPEGVKGVKVSCNSFVKFSSCYTDENGYYKMTRSYSVPPRYRLVFHNVKGFNQGFNFILVPASVSTFGVQPASGFSIEIDSNSESKLFTRCVVNNAGYDYINAVKASSGAIPAPPKDFRIWDIDLLEGSLATMIHHGVLVETMSELAEMPNEYVLLIKIVQPDALLGLSGVETYADAYGKGMYIFAHAAHFSQTSKDWWWNYLQFAIRSLVSSTLTDTSGAPGDFGCEYGEIAEMYAHYCRNAMMRRRYPDTDNLTGITEWFTPQLLMYLDDRGLGLEKLAPLFTEDVVGIEVLRNKLLSYYPQFKNVINEAFARYDK